MQLIELPSYREEREQLKDLMRIIKSKKAVVGSGAGQIYLRKPEGNQETGFVKSIFPPSDIDILIDQSTFSKISNLVTSPSFPIVEVNYRFTGEEATYLPIPFYKLKQFNNVDIFVGKVGVIPADSKAYTSGGSITIDGYVVNAAYKPYTVATWINPLAATEIRIIRSIILLANERVENGEEQLKAEVAEVLRYVKEGKREVNLIMEELESKDPNNSILHYNDFINYGENCENIAKYITSNPFKEKLLRILTKVGQPKEESEQTIETIAAEIKNNYYEILREVKR